MPCRQVSTFNGTAGSGKTGGGGHATEAECNQACKGGAWQPACCFDATGLYQGNATTAGTACGCGSVMARGQAVATVALPTQSTSRRRTVAITFGGSVSGAAPKPDFRIARWAALDGLSIEFEVPECGGGYSQQYFQADPVAPDPTWTCNGTITQEPASAKTIVINVDYRPPAATPQGPYTANITLGATAKTRYQCWPTVLSYGFNVYCFDGISVPSFNFAAVSQRINLRGQYDFALYSSSPLWSEWGAGQSSAYIDVTISEPQ